MADKHNTSYYTVYDAAQTEIIHLLEARLIEATAEAVAEAAAEAIIKAEAEQKIIAQEVNERQNSYCFNQSANAESID
jgi:hypothetical protein